MRRLVMILGPAALLLGCAAPATPTAAATPTPAPTAAAPTTTAPVAPPVVTPRPPETPAPTVDAVDAVDAADAVDEPPPPSAPATPPDARFQLAVYRDGALDLHRLGDEVFVSGAGGLARLDARGERMVHVEYALSGQTPPDRYAEEWIATSLGGVWPTNAWLSTESQYSRGGSQPQLHRREGNFWKLQPLRDGRFFRSYAPILNGPDGQVLGLRTFHLDHAGIADETDIPRSLQRKIDADRAKLEPGLDILGPTITPAPMVLAADFITDALAAAPTGELFALAHRREAPAGVAHVQRWGLTGDAAITGTIDALPAGLRCTVMTVRAADDAYVACTRVRAAESLHLTHFDGHAWTEEPAPPVKAIHQLGAGGPGELYAVASIEDDGWKHALWHRPTRDAAWTAVELPALRFADRAGPEWVFSPSGHEFVLDPADPGAAEASWIARPFHILVRPDGEVWVAAETELVRTGLAGFATARNVVLRNRKIGPPLRMLAHGDLELELLDWRPAPAWTPAGCGDPGEDRMAFLPIRTLPRDAPRNQPEPLLAPFIAANAALMPQIVHIVEVHRRGRRTLGLFVRPADQAGADALLAAVEQAAPGDKRTIECRLPRIRREFDKATGAALQAPLQ